MTVKGWMLMFAVMVAALALRWYAGIDITARDEGNASYALVALLFAAAVGYAAGD